VEHLTRDGMKPAPVKPEMSRRVWAVSRKHFALNGSLADRVISLVHILGCPVRNAAGMRIGRVSDIVVHWDVGDEHPPVTGIIVTVRGALAAVQQADVTLSQTEIRLQTDARMDWRPVWGNDDVALARDVLDRQLVDTSRVQVVQSPDAYLLNGPQGWELAGIDVGLPFGRRLVKRRRACPPPDRVIDWTQLQAIVPEFSGTANAAGR
jgi:sporulation protein YlmC with PRC-barrel domain